ncbi:hypothetical protein CB1_000370041 [Camelus ferus]|nr:hypothetical protein CB1_000370041 [Camelus ferus]
MQRQPAGGSGNFLRAHSWPLTCSGPVMLAPAFSLPASSAGFAVVPGAAAAQLGMAQHLFWERHFDISQSAFPEQGHFQRQLFPKAESPGVEAEGVGTWIMDWNQEKSQIIVVQAFRGEMERPDSIFRYNVNDAAGMFGPLVWGGCSGGIHADPFGRSPVRYMALQAYLEEHTSSLERLLLDEGTSGFRTRPEVAKEITNAQSPVLPRSRAAAGHEDPGPDQSSEGSVIQEKRLGVKKQRQLQLQCLYISASWCLYPGDKNKPESGPANEIPWSGEEDRYA